MKEVMEIDGDYEWKNIKYKIILAEEKWKWKKFTYICFFFTSCIRNYYDFFEKYIRRNENVYN